MTSQYAEGTERFLQMYRDVMPADFHEQPPAEQRRLYHALSDVFPYRVPDGIRVRDVELVHEGRRSLVRLYVPAQVDSSGLIVYLHGGGFVVGSLDSHHTLVAELADKTRTVAVSVDFRLAPEAPFPAALEDCVAAVRVLATRPPSLDTRFEPDAMVLCGDSSGANLAVAVAMACRDRGGPRLRGLGLISPVLDFLRWQRGDQDDALLGGEMEFYTAAYCPDPETAAHPYVSPLVAGTFARLPPTYVVSSELDSLRQDGERFAERMEQEGIPVRHVVEPGLVHAPMRGRSLIPQAAAAWDRFCAAVGSLTGNEKMSPSGL